MNGRCNSVRSPHVFRVLSWWFEDETGMEYGPYETEEQAYAEFVKYCEAM